MPHVAHNSIHHIRWESNSTHSITILKYRYWAYNNRCRLGADTIDIYCGITLSFLITTSVNTTSRSDYTFQGWVGLDKDGIGIMKWQAVEPKLWDDTDVYILITHSGNCGPGAHILRSSWVSVFYCLLGCTKSDI